MDGTGQPDRIDEGLMQRAIASDRDMKLTSEEKLYEALSRGGFKTEKKGEATKEGTMTEPHFDQAVRRYRDELKSDRLHATNDDGQLVLEKASECDLSGMLDFYAKFIKNANLISEGLEHLEPNEKSARAKAQVSEIINALDMDIIEALQNNCGCGEKR